MVLERVFGHDWPFRPAGADLANPRTQLAVPSAVADSMVALRLRLARLGSKVRMPSRLWRRRGVDALRSGLTCRLGVAQLRDLQRITFALFDWNPGHFDKDAMTVLSWCDAHMPAPPRLPLLLLRLRHQYDQLCDLRALEWADLITRLSPELPEVVVRDWLSLLVFEALEDDTVAAEWFSYLAAGSAVEAVALGIAVGDVEFLETISQSLLYGPQPAIDRPAIVHDAAAPIVAPEVRDEDKTGHVNDGNGVIAPEEPETPESPDGTADAGSADLGRGRASDQVDSEHAGDEGRDARPAGAFVVPTLTEQARVKLAHALNAAAQLAAERSEQRLLETPGSGDDSVSEAELNPLGCEAEAPTEPVFREDCASAEEPRLHRLAEQALKALESRHEKSAAMPVPPEARKGPEIMSRGEAETPAAAPRGAGIPVSIIFACVLLLAGVVFAWWWFYPGAGGPVEQHASTIEHPSRQSAESPEPPPSADGQSNIAPAAVAPSAPAPADEAGSPGLPRSAVTGSSLNIREAFLLVASCFIVLFDLYLAMHWNDAENEGPNHSAG